MEEGHNLRVATTNAAKATADIQFFAVQRALPVLVPLAVPDDLSASISTNCSR